MDTNISMRSVMASHERLVDGHAVREKGLKDNMCMIALIAGVIIILLLALLIWLYYFKKSSCPVCNVCPVCPAVASFGSSCSTTLGCVAPLVCDRGTCKQPLGAACTVDDNCSGLAVCDSNVCVGGFGNVCKNSTQCISPMQCLDVYNTGTNICSVQDLPCIADEDCATTNGPTYSCIDGTCTL